jgi:hypothetical protein
MKPIQEVFNLHRAKSGLFSDYEPGDVAFVGNGLGDNAVLGYVAPLAKDRVFNCRAIVISAFCEATVQMPPFIACGRAGNGLVVLEAKTPTTLGKLAFTAAYINQAVRWRFNWYRQTTVDRLKNIPVPDNAPQALVFPVVSALPNVKATTRPEWSLKTDPFELHELFDMAPGDYHVLGELPKGSIPVVSCGERQNGIAGFFDVPGPHYRDRLTIALNGSPLLCKYHPYDFAAKDDVAICTPKHPLRLTTLLFVQVALNRERWRYSYYRKCYMDKLRRFRIYLPAAHGEVDEETMEAVLRGAPYWDYLEKQLVVAPA